MIPSSLFSLQGKRALVTGSSRGIGKATAMLLGQAGADVIFHASSMSSKLMDAVKEAQEQGIKATAIAADLSNLEQTQKLIHDAGTVDLLILNASVQQYMTVETMEPEEFAREYNVNVRSSIMLIKGFLPGMKERKFGRIVALGSVNQYRPAARLCLYGGTKAAQNNLMNCVAKTYGPYGITANNVAPGVITTDRNAEILSHPEIAERLLNIIPSARFGTAEDCAGIILLLCAPAGSYINGAEITVDGGMNL